MQTYGFKQLKILKLNDDLTPASDATVKVIDGTPKNGATTSFDLTGLTKEPTKVYGSNIAYFLARKGHGNIAANFGLLDLPAELEHEILGHTKGATDVYHLGEDTEAPYYAVLVESEDLYGEKVGFGLYAGTFSRDGYSAATKSDEDFTPEAGEYVFTPISKQIGDKNVTVGFADDTASFTALSTELFGAQE